MAIIQVQFVNYYHTLCLSSINYVLTHSSSMCSERSPILLPYPKSLKSYAIKTKTLPDFL